MKTSVFATLLLLGLMALKPVEKMPFPPISGELLSGPSLSIPSDTKGKITLIGVAYSKKSDEELKTWFDPVYKTFIHKPEGGNQLFSLSGGFDVNVYFVAMLRGVAQAASGKIEKQLEKKVDKKLHPHLLLYQGAIKEYKNSLGLSSKDTPYFFVLDKDGNIIHRTEGAYSYDKISQVEDLIMDME